jgi:hypothetical protein
MTGHNAFDQLVTETIKNRVAFEKQVPYEDYELWQKDVIWDCLHGLRYGQSFCNRFGLTDNLLYYTTWPSEQIDEYIKKHYVARS